MPLFVSDDADTTGALVSVSPDIQTRCTLMAAAPRSI
jgi:hypothetical protein